MTINLHIKVEQRLIQPRRLAGMRALTACGNRRTEDPNRGFYGSRRPQLTGSAVVAET